MADRHALQDAALKVAARNQAAEPSYGHLKQPALEFVKAPRAIRLAVRAPPQQRVLRAVRASPGSPLLGADSVVRVKSGRLVIQAAEPERRFSRRSRGSPQRSWIASCGTCSGADRTDSADHD